MRYDNVEFDVADAFVADGNDSGSRSINDVSPSIGVVYAVTAFTVDVDDELIPFEIAASPGRDFFANAGKSNRRGLELAVSTEPVPGLSLSLGSTTSLTQRLQQMSVSMHLAGDFSSPVPTATFTVASLFGIGIPNSSRQRPSGRNATGFVTDAKLQ